MVMGFRFRVQGSGFRVQGFGLVVAMLLATAALGQDFFFTYAKDTTITLGQNVKLVEQLRVNIHASNSLDGETKIFIPTRIEIKGKVPGLFTHNHLCQYSFDGPHDLVDFKKLKTVGYEIDFEAGTVKPKNQNDNENDHYKPADREKKVKEKKKKQL